jgi:hypothetical protein
MDHAKDQGSFWADLTAVFAVAFTIGALYLPLVLWPDTSALFSALRRSVRQAPAADLATAAVLPGHVPNVSFRTEKQTLPKGVGAHAPAHRAEPEVRISDPKGHVRENRIRLSAQADALL